MIHSSVVLLLGRKCLGTGVLLGFLSLLVPLGIYQKFLISVSTSNFHKAEVISSMQNNTQEENNS